jgi:toluene monooxygenase system protein E
VDRVSDAPRTYWHLADLPRRPTDYDVTSGRLNYHVERGAAVRTPAGAWAEARRAACPLRVRDWDRFHDPRETTYARYVALQREQEIYVDGVCRWMDEGDHDRRLAPAWLATLGDALGPLPYVGHGLQMIACQIGHLAPSGRLAIAAGLQAADELRRVQRFCYRIAQLRRAHPGFAADGAAAWQRDPTWQPLRRVIERLLVTYDWGEALIATSLVLKPRLDELVLGHLAGLAERAGDPMFANLLRSLGDDARWHRSWVAAFVRLCLEDAATNGPVLRGWVARWTPEVDAALAPFAAWFGDAGPATLRALADAQAALAADAGLR